MANIVESLYRVSINENILNEAPTGDFSYFENSTKEGTFDKVALAHDKSIINRKWLSQINTTSEFPNVNLNNAIDFISDEFNEDLQHKIPSLKRRKDKNGLQILKSGYLDLCNDIQKAFNYFVIPSEDNILYEDDRYFVEFSFAFGLSLAVDSQGAYKVINSGDPSVKCKNIQITAKTLAGLLNRLDIEQFFGDLATARDFERKFELKKDEFLYKLLQARAHEGLASKEELSKEFYYQPLEELKEKINLIEV